MDPATAAVLLGVAHYAPGDGDAGGGGGTAVAEPESLKDVNEAIEAERKHLKLWLDKFDRDEDGALKMTSDDVTQFQKRNGALGILVKKAEAIRSATQTLIDLKAPAGRLVVPTAEDLNGGVMSKSIGEMFIDSAAYKSRPTTRGSVGPVYVMDVDQLYGKGRGFKTLFDTATGFAIQNIRLPQPLTPAEQPVTIASLMPEGRTSGNAIPYMEETTTTNAAAETDQGASKPEAALAFTERTSNVRKIAVQIPVTDEALEDIPFIESYLDTRLSLFVRQREDAELLKGDATGVNLRGIQNTSGILTQARGTDANQDAIFKALIKVQSQGFLYPTGVVLNPLNWQTMRLMTTADGIYIFGPPNLPGPDTIWGLNVVSTTAETANTALVGAFRTAAEVFRRTDLSLQVGWINDQFIKNQRTIVVEERLALVVFRPKGFCTVTGLN
jgi:HK97 family phage major capsid protein